MGEEVHVEDEEVVEEVPEEVEEDSVLLEEAEELMPDPGGGIIRPSFDEFFASHFLRRNGTQRVFFSK